MPGHEIYALTPLGENELRGSVTTLSPAQLDLLVRIDGVLTFTQIKAGMPEVSLEAFTSTFDSLLFRRLLSKAQTDPFADQFKIQLNKMALSRAEAEADSGAASLRKTGYYVRIARQRGAGRTLAPGEVLSAIVVDDEPMLAKFIQSYLSLEGFHVRLAGNRAEVIAEFRRPQIPDLILLDVMLPDADGFDILLRLRQHPALKNVPVIMLTGKATREAVIKGLACGADGYITKPFEAEALMHAVRTVVGLPEDPAATTSTDLWINTKSKF
ncbi:MAG: response regulator [Polaromonas sp. 39-63-203]|uniref:response regulator transcription factor n=1 Tax=Polaromonas sp. TaxID=1869339 RepID=UPI000BC98335|nr:response regulator [Polaromonas sp.]OYY52746.1 MAG: response regulator [Polaromonas sp. 35-63-240]OYZ83731.1 MAG: response regulator [Polaromonas sp. 24-62-144]OZA97835.1 MAG: response regulator [Polaromonas sp. 39-63-203]HQS31996.1 response regulator [Polaromonas sp.]HQS91280.1 response regulator [Polaromonas sp.]